MDNKYTVYEVYGRDKPNYYNGVTPKIIIGRTREYNNIKSIWNAINDNSLNFRTDNIMIIDWSHYRIKIIYNGIQTIWKKFKSHDFFNEFRFTTPCEDWEIDSKGYIV